VTAKGKTLLEAGGLTDTPAGRAAHAKYLAWQAAEGPAGKNAAYVAMSRGWALGSADFKANLIADHVLPETSRAWDLVGAREIREVKRAGALAGALRLLGRTAAEASADRKSAPWKVAVAAHLKATTQADNRWLAARLHLGSPTGVSFLTGKLRRGQSPEAVQLLAQLATKRKS